MISTSINLRISKNLVVCCWLVVWFICLFCFIFFLFFAGGYLQKYCSLMSLFRFYFAFDFYTELISTNCYNVSSSCGGDGPEIDNVGKLVSRGCAWTTTAVVIVGDVATAVVVATIGRYSKWTGDNRSLWWHSTSNSIVSGRPVPLSSVSHSRFSEKRRYFLTTKKNKNKKLIWILISGGFHLKRAPTVENKDTDLEVNFQRN